MVYLGMLEILIKYINIVNTGLSLAYLHSLLLIY